VNALQHFDATLIHHAVSTYHKPNNHAPLHVSGCKIFEHFEVREKGVVQKNTL
jgi:hypothetical protein